MKNYRTKKIFIAGHNGMVGSSILKLLRENGYENIITVNKEEVDLRNQSNVDVFLEKNEFEVIIIAAARVGGILANQQYPWNFIYENLMIECNLINSAISRNVEKIIFLGSSCIYPKFSEQPLKEEYLLTGSLEPTNEWYAIAKIAGIKLCQAANLQFQKSYISLMPTNLYGEKDNFDLNTSHVLPAMIRKFYEAKINGNEPVILWGSGSPMREFLHVDDLANAVLHFLDFERKLEFDLYNVGTGVDLTIKSLAELIQKIVGHEGRIVWDQSKPNGTPRKLLDISRIKNIGWSPKIDLEIGIENTYKWFLSNINDYKQVKL